VSSRSLTRPPAPVAGGEVPEHDDLGLGQWRGGDERGAQLFDRGQVAAEQCALDDRGIEVEMSEQPERHPLRVRLAAGAGVTRPHVG